MCVCVCVNKASHVKKNFKKNSFCVVFFISFCNKLPSFYEECANVIIQIYVYEYICVHMYSYVCVSVYIYIIYLASIPLIKGTNKGVFIYSHALIV